MTYSQWLRYEIYGFLIALVISLIIAGGIILIGKIKKK